MLDKDLAKLYAVETRVLNQAVKRNIEGLPEDFMFKLSQKEFSNMMSQNVISNWGGNRKLPNPLLKTRIGKERIKENFSETINRFLSSQT